MRVHVILRLATLAILALFAAGAVPALSSSSSKTGHLGFSLRRVSMQPGVTPSDRAFGPTPLRVANPAAYRKAKAEADAGYERWLRAHPTAAGASHDSGRPTSVYGGLNHTGLDARSQPDPHTPPDTTGAAGPSDYVEFVNEELGVYSKTDLSAPTETINESAFVGTPDENVCDANIQWDQQGGRWLYSAIGPCAYGAPGYFLYFGWSKGSSPTLTASNWCQYAIDTGAAVEDYPKLGHDDSQILIGVNEFGPRGIFARAFVLDKPADATSCPDPATEESTATVLTLGKRGVGGAWTPVAANLADASDVGYFVATDFDDRHLHVYTVGRDGNQANVLLNSQTVKVRPFCEPPSVPQKGTKNTLESLDARFTQAVAVTDPGTGEEGIWTQHTVASWCEHGHPRGPSVVRWYELAPGASTPTQKGTVGGTNGAFAFLGAISPSSDGQNAAIFYNQGSSTTLAEFRVRDRHSLTTGGQMVEDLLLATSAYADKDRSCYGPMYPCRWGDYNGASPDPVDPNLIWGTGEITVSPPDYRYGTPQWGSDNAAIDVTPAADYGLDVTVTNVRAGTGSVSSIPDGIAVCISSCSHVYAYGTPVELIATPGVHSIVRWSGDCSGIGAACNLVLGGPQNVTATFLPLPVPLSYTRRGNGSGRVTFSPAVPICKWSCLRQFDYGTLVRLTAVAGAHSVFKGWSGACSGRHTCRVRMNDAKSVKANFGKRRR